MPWGNVCRTPVVCDTPFSLAGKSTGSGTGVRNTVCHVGVTRGCYELGEFVTDPFVPGTGVVTNSPHFVTGFTNVVGGVRNTVFHSIPQYYGVGELNRACYELPPGGGGVRNRGFLFGVWVMGNGAGTLGACC
jgi:hypothetical protein